MSKLYVVGIGPGKFEGMTHEAARVLAEKLGLLFLTYSAEELKAVPGDFTPSVFVKETTGVESVCERAAVLASGGTLVVRKVAENGMTFSLARQEEAIRFE